MKRRIDKRTYQKRVTTIILAVTLFDIQLCILATFFDKVIPTEICVALITDVLGIFIAYTVKSYLGKKEEEKTRLLEGKDNEL